MPNQEPAIIVKDVRKSFRIPLDKSSGLKQRVVNFYKRKKGYREFTALDGVSFEVKKGEFFGIVGRNGSGKSTLLKILAGVYSPDSGGVAVNGSLTPFIELGVGFNPELTGRENVFLNGALLGFSRQEMEVMYESIVDFAELHDFMEERLKNYSSGMQVRLAFSIAIRADSDILVLDEVLAVGDSAFQNKCFEYFRSLKNNNKTVILVTHSMDSVMSFCDRAMMLESGKVYTIGSVNKVTDVYYEKNVASPQKNREDKTKKPKTAQLGDVHLLNEKGEVVTNFASGENITLAIPYEVRNKGVRKLNVGVGLHHTNTNAHMLGYNTLFDSFDVRPANGIVKLNIKNLSLQKGIYHFSVRLFGEDKDKTYDDKPSTLSVSVSTAGSTADFGGLVKFEHTWSGKDG